MKLIKTSLHIIKSLATIVLLTSCPGLIDYIVTEDLGNGYKYHEIVGFPTISKDNPYRSITQIVVDYKYDDNFITAVQKDYQFNQTEKETITLDDQYEIITKEGKIQYWIIVKVSDSIIGPFDKSEYQLKCKELSIPEKIIVNY